MTESRPPRKNARARAEVRTADKFTRHRSRIEREDKELDEILRQTISEAEAQGLSTLTKVNPKTGKGVTVLRQRKGRPEKVEAVGDIVETLRDLPTLLDKILPPVITQRQFDWSMVDEFLTREYPQGSPEQIAQRQVVAAMAQRYYWSHRPIFPKRRRCILCNAEFAYTPSPFDVCEAHRDLFKWPQMHSLLQSGKIEPARFNELSDRAYRSRFVRDDRWNEYEQIAPTRRRRKSPDTSAPDVPAEVGAQHAAPDAAPDPDVSPSTEA